MIGAKIPEYSILGDDITVKFAAVTNNKDFLRTNDVRKEKSVNIKVLELITAQTDISLRPSVIAVIVAVPLGLALRPAAAKFVLPCPDVDRK